MSARKKWLTTLVFMITMVSLFISCQSQTVEVGTGTDEQEVGAEDSSAPDTEDAAEADAAEADAAEADAAEADEADETESDAAETGEATIDELVIGQVGNPVSLTCWDNTSLDEVDILNHFVEPLFQFNREGKLQGVVAESWEMVSPTEWIIHIRQGLKFHDPKYGELTAEDVVASLDACFKPEGRSAPKMAQPILDREVEIIDDYTIRVTMPEPGTVGLPNYWVIGYISDKEYLEEVGDDFSQQPMGTGPFKFVEWKPNVEIVAERFEDYWGEVPQVERLVWRIIPDDFTRKNEFVTGGIDVLPFMRADWLPEIEANPDLRMESVLSSRFIMIVLPVREPPYDDIRVRQALNYAVNKQEIVDQLFLGVGADPLRGATNPFLPEVDPEREGYPYDPEKAKELLDEARADGVELGTLTLYAPNDRYNLDKEVGEAVAGYWRAIGLDVEYIPQSRSVLFPAVQAFETKDPFLFGHGNNLVRSDYTYNLWIKKREDPPSRGYVYTNGPDEWDTLIEELGQEVSGSDGSIEKTRALDQMITEYAPWIFLINYVDLYGVSNEVEWSPYPTELRLFHDAGVRE